MDATDEQSPHQQPVNSHSARHTSHAQLPMRESRQSLGEPPCEFAWVTCKCNFVRYFDAVAWVAIPEPFPRHRNNARSF